MKSNDKKITIRFNEADKDLYEYLTGLDNTSKFIRDAVREKIENDKKFSFDIKNAVKEVVEEMGLTKEANKQNINNKGELSSEIQLFSDADDEDLKRALDSFEL